MTTEYQEFVLAAHEAGLDVGTSSYGDILHAVDFDTDSVRAKAKGEPDELACGKASDAERVDDGEEREICGNCLVELGVKEKRVVTDGGASVRERAESFRPTSIEEIDTEEQCQTYYGPGHDRDELRCQSDAKYEVVLENDYDSDDPIEMKVCPGCKRAYQSRGERQ